VPVPGACWDYKIYIKGALRRVTPDLSNFVTYLSAMLMHEDRIEHVETLTQ
jgi:hypothetical protein